MKYTVLFLLFVLGIGQINFAQGVAINDDGSDPHPSAILDIASNNKGVLLPRTPSVSSTIEDPAMGLVAVNTNDSTCRFWNGNDWDILNNGPKIARIFISPSDVLQLKQHRVELLPFPGDGSFYHIFAVYGRLVSAGAPYTSNPYGIILRVFDENEGSILAEHQFLLPNNTSSKPSQFKNVPGAIEGEYRTINSTVTLGVLPADPTPQNEGVGSVLEIIVLFQKISF